MNMANLDLYNKFKKVPNEAKKSIVGGRLKGFTDINPMWRIKTLTEEFGAVGIGWYTEVVNRHIEEGANGEKAAFISLNLYVKIGEEWSKPIYGEGGSSFIANEKAGKYTSDECFKMAETDALSVACKKLGIGADVYYDRDSTKYDVVAENKSNTPIKKETKPTTEQNTVVEAISLAAQQRFAKEELANATTADEALAVWKKYTQLQTEEFKEEVKKRRKELSDATKKE